MSNNQAKFKYNKDILRAVGGEAHASRVKGSNRITKPITLVGTAKPQFCNVYFILPKQSAFSGCFDLSFYITEFTRVFKIFISVANTRYKFSKINIILFGYVNTAEKHILTDRLNNLKEYIESSELFATLNHHSTPLVCWYAQFFKDELVFRDFTECAANIIVINRFFLYLLKDTAQYLPSAYHKYYDVPIRSNSYSHCLTNNDNDNVITKRLEIFTVFLPNKASDPKDRQTAFIQHILLPYHLPMGSSWVYKIFNPYTDNKILRDLAANRSSKMHTNQGEITICIPNEPPFIPTHTSRISRNSRNNTTILAKASLRCLRNRRYYLKKKQNLPPKSKSNRYEANRRAYLLKIKTLGRRIDVLTY